MRVRIKTINSIDRVTITNLDKKLLPKLGTIFIGESWHKLLIPCNRHNIIDITISESEESIKHCLNSGRETEKGYEIWLHGNIATYFSRISECFAQDDLLTFKDVSKKYLLTESWNEKVEGDYILTSDKQFFANGEGPYWWHKDNFHNLPYVTINKELSVNKEQLLKELDMDLTVNDTKFYKGADCISLQKQPELPCVNVNDLKSPELKKLMTAVGFTQILQMQRVTLNPNSVIPMHRDDFLYQSGRHIIAGPTQFYIVLEGNPKDFYFKFAKAGLIDVSKPTFINNYGFVHSLIYSGTTVRTTFLAYGISDLTNGSFIKQ
jgi:hypothetical protein